jgi:hypothetical protein
MTETANHLKPHEFVVEGGKVYEIVEKHENTQHTGG